MFNTYSFPSLLYKRKRIKNTMHAEIREKRLKFLDKLNMFMIKYNCLKIKYQIYLWIDKWTENPCVAGSIPAQATIMKNEELSFKT